MGGTGSKPNSGEDAKRQHGQGGNGKEAPGATSSPGSSTDSPQYNELRTMAESLGEGDIDGLRNVLIKAKLAQLAAAEMHELRKVLKEYTGLPIPVIKKTETELGLKEEEAGAAEEAENQTRRPPFATYEPPRPPEAVMPLADILEEARYFLRERVITSQEALDTAVLWAGGTWGVGPGVTPGQEAAAELGPNIFPRLHLKSGAPGSGKTTLLESIGAIARRSFAADGMSASAFFRLVEQHQPTLLLDEADAWIVGNESLRGLINSGHRRAGVHVLSEKVKTKKAETWEPKAFRTHSPLALAGLGALASTIEDRAITITMIKTGGRVERSRDRDLITFRDRIGPHLAAHADAPASAMAEGVADAARFPPGLSPRAMDNWEAIFKVADVAGGDWPARALAACVALGNLAPGARALGRGERLLADLREFHRERMAERWRMRQLFPRALPKEKKRRPSRTQRRSATSATDIHEWRSFGNHHPIWMLPTTAFLEWLGKRDNESYWSTADRGRPASAAAIAQVLRTFEVHPDRHVRRTKEGPETIRGYRVADLKPLWRTHLPPPAQGSSTFLNE
jgi:hypothetical protein